MQLNASSGPDTGVRVFMTIHGAWMGFTAGSHCPGPSCQSPSPLNWRRGRGCKTLPQRLPCPSVKLPDANPDTAAVAVAAAIAVVAAVAVSVVAATVVAVAAAAVVAAVAGVVAVVAAVAATVVVVAAVAAHGQTNGQSKCSFDR
jgi:hypothetical protein